MKCDRCRGLIHSHQPHFMGGVNKGPVHYDIKVCLAVIEARAKALRTDNVIG